MPRRLIPGAVSLLAVTLSTALAAGQRPSAPPRPYPTPQVDDVAQVPVVRLLDEVAPNQRILPVARFVDPSVAVPMGTPDPNEELLREINRLHKEREDLAKERAKLEGRAPEADSPAAVELAQLRQRLAVVLQRLAATPPPAIRPPANTTRETTANPREFNPAGPAVVTSPISGRPLGDPFLQAQALFRGGKYKDALAAYRALQPESLNSDERLLVQYLCACCLRKLGKLDEAATLYRQVADAREDDFLTECSLWHLGTIGWRRDIEKQLADVRAACQAR